MNKIFKVIFSKAKGIVVTGENAKAQGKSKHLKVVATSVMIASTLGMIGNVMANPIEISPIRNDTTNLENALNNNDVQIIADKDSISLKEGTYRINGHDHNLTLENNSPEGWSAALNLSRSGAGSINGQNSFEFKNLKDINFTSTGKNAFGIWVGRNQNGDEIAWNLTIGSTDARVGNITIAANRNSTAAAGLKISNTSNENLENSAYIYSDNNISINGYNGITHEGQNLVLDATNKIGISGTNYGIKAVGNNNLTSLTASQVEVNTTSGYGIYLDKSDLSIIAKNNDQSGRININSNNIGISTAYNDAEQKIKLDSDVISIHTTQGSAALHVANYSNISTEKKKTLEINARKSFTITAEDGSKSHGILAYGLKDSSINTPELTIQIANDLDGKNRHDSIRLYNSDLTITSAKTILDSDGGIALINSHLIFENATNNNQTLDIKAKNQWGINANNNSLLQIKAGSVSNSMGVLVGTGGTVEFGTFDANGQPLNALEKLDIRMDSDYFGPDYPSAILADASGIRINNGTVKAFAKEMSISSYGTTPGIKLESDKANDSPTNAQLDINVTDRLIINDGIQIQNTATSYTKDENGNIISTTEFENDGQYALKINQNEQATGESL